MKRFTTLLLIISLTFLVGCNPYATQTVNYLNNHDCFLVSTYVWYDSEIIYSEYKCPSIDSLKVVRIRQLEEVKALAQELREALK